jgi:hypothetical protein
MLLAQSGHTIPQIFDGLKQGMLNNLAYTVEVRCNVVLCRAITPRPLTWRQGR